MSRICILGGGFGGLYTALRLSQLPWTGHEKPEITLVDKCDRFVFLPLLYEVVTGDLQSWEVAPYYSELLSGTGIRYVQATVDSVNLAGRTVQITQNGQAERLSYDRLVLAMGGESVIGNVSGAADNALPFRTLNDALRLSDRLKDLEASAADRIRVAIIGGGYSGVELACNLAERLGDRGRVRIVELGDRILNFSPDFNRKAAEKALTDRKVWTDLQTKTSNVTSDEITLQYDDKSETLPVDLVLWTVGTRISEVIQSLPLPMNNRGQVKVQTTLQVEGYPEVYALGDLADCKDADGQIIPTTAQAAFQQADYAGWNLWASLTDRPLLTFKYQHLGEMMTLGSDDATLAGLGLQLNGVSAHLARRMIYLMRMPTFAHQVKVGLNWITKPATDFLKSLTKTL
ncbi:MAG: NAD(P)/FAD-dependent oxidoreductase [Cyanobacteria bacterium]|nr:NAD(P)/FAD-dependent oxidoreductase [Cyanobacteriota bacterium]